MGSIYVRGTKLWFRVKHRSGQWKSIRSDFEVGEEAAARAALKLVEERANAEASISTSESGPLTLRQYAKRWLEGRRAEVESYDNDESRLRLYVYPELGDLPLADIRPRHIRDFIKKLRQRKTQRTKSKLAPRTVYNTYALLSALFRDAAVDGVIENTPCILTAAHLGPKIDGDPDWRALAHYSRSELVALVSDPRIDLDRRVLWALMGIGGLRPGEAFGLAIHRIDWSVAPLASMRVVTSHKRGRTKTNVNRTVPIHPALERILRHWLTVGWEEVMGRAPTPNDLVVPLPASNRGPAGRMRSNNRTLKQLHADLELLGLRRRRVHDLRHTMISLSRTDGANKDILRRVTHQPPKEVIEGYTHFEWEVVCAEVSKLKLDGLVTPPLDAATPPPPPQTAPEISTGCGLVKDGLATVLATSGARTKKNPVSIAAYGVDFLRGVGDLNP